MMKKKIEEAFPFLDQKGPFATFDIAPAQHNTFSNSSKQWIRLIETSLMSAKYRAMRNQIYELLNIKSFNEIKDLIQNPTKKASVSQRAYMLLGNMFGIEGTPGEIVFRINSYAQIADSVIDYLKNSIFADITSNIELTNEIESTNDPVELLLIVFNDRYHKKARFEAKRKLVLMHLIGSIVQRERETDIENKFSKFLDFLNQHVWSQELKIGELEISYLLSVHDETTFACKKVDILDEQAGRTHKVQAYEKLTALKRRCFWLSGKKIPVYVTIRKKSPEAKVLKLLRKGEKNPAVAVDDELGLMGVFNSVIEVRAFQRHLTESATRSGSFITLEDISDSLESGKYASVNAGSSPDIRMYKFFARMGGMRVEFIIHTNETYMNYIYQREISHSEYEIRRIIDSGVAELLFPQDIFRLDLKELKTQLIQRHRIKIEKLAYN